MKTATVWMRPTRVSPACSYSYDPEKGKLTTGRRIYSDCGVWLTFYTKDIVLEEPGVDLCPHCKAGTRVAPMREPPPFKPKRPPTVFLTQNA